MQLTTGKKIHRVPSARFLRIFTLLNSACGVSGLLDWHGPPQGRFALAVGQLDCIREFAEVDYTSDLQKFDVAS
jgi:hypothetical protein